MGLPVTVYRWDDDGAPQLTNRKPSEIIDVLKKCLVDGYGSKQPLGWTTAFEDAVNFKIAFRNSPTDGTGGYVQFWAVNGSDSDGGNVRFRGAKSMTGIDQFIHEQIQMQFSLGTNCDKWVVIGTSRSFWIFVHSRTDSPSGSSVNKLNAFIGDIESFTPNDPGAFVNVYYHTQNDMTESSWNYEFSYSMDANSVLCRIYGIDGSSDSQVYRMDGNFSIGNSVNGIPTQNRVFNKPLIRSYSMSATLEYAPNLRGYIPGLLYSTVGGYADQPWPVIETIGDQDAMLMPGYYFGKSWVTMENWYE